MRILSLFLTALPFALGACTDDGQTVEAPAVEGRAVAVDSLRPDPGVIVNLDVAFVTQVTVTRGGTTYSASVAEGTVGVNGDVVPAALGPWLARYAPLRAEGVVAGLAPDSLILAPDAQVSFRFSDGSGRVVSFRNRGDSVAVVSQPAGPVYRLPAGHLDALAPPAEALRR